MNILYGIAGILAVLIGLALRGITNSSRKSDPYDKGIHQAGNGMLFGGSLTILGSILRLRRKQS